MIITNNTKSDLKKISFKGMEPARTSTGREAFDFFLPYDTEKYTKAEVELVPLKMEGTKFAVDKDCTPVTVSLDQNGKATVNPARVAVGNQAFAYRFKLTDTTGKSTYHTDSGIRTEAKDTANYAVVLRNRTKVTNPAGTIIHLMPDNHNVGWSFDSTGKLVEDPATRARALGAKRNHFSTYGGNIAGIVQDIPRMHEMGYDLVLATPLFGGDEVSNHGYWTTNPFQMTKKNGTFEDFIGLNVELHKKGMALIADGAFVNEGMEGYRFKHIQKWGVKRSPYVYNFRMTGSPTIKNLPGVDPKSAEGKEIYSHIKIHVVNGNKKFTCSDNGIESTSQQRDPKKLTYVQLYDDRTLSAKQREQIQKGELIDPSLSEHTTGNHYDITNDNHSVILRKFEISEDEIPEFEKRMEDNKDLYSSNKLAFLQTALSFRNFNIDTHADNFEAWDGNADIAKLRYGYSMKDEENFALSGTSLEEKRKYQQGGYQNQDHIQKVAMFWTQSTKNGLVEHSARVLSQSKTGAAGYRAILDANRDGNTSVIHPMSAEVMDDAVIANVLNGKYRIPELKTTSNVKDRLTEDLMNLPLESIEFSPDVTAVLGTPFVSKKAFTKEDVRKTRYEFYQDKEHLDRVPQEYAAVYAEADDFYATTLASFASDVVKKADTENKFVDPKGELTDAGKLALPLIARDIMKFAVVKALAPDVKIENKNGRLVYDQKALGEVSLKNIAGSGISSNSPEDEAHKVVALMKKGVAGISDADKALLADSIKQRFEGIKESDLKMAYVQVDRTASGLNWRTDATKDTAPIGEVRDGWENFASVMDEAKEFWTGFADSIREVNPNAYIIGEMTDTKDLMGLTDGVSGAYDNNMELETNFVNDTGVSGLSNYSYFFSSVLGTLSTGTDSGKRGENLDKVKAKIQEGRLDGWNVNKGFIFQYAQDGVKTSHNFAANHDKPRLLSIFALDNQLFHWNYAEAQVKEDYTKAEKAAADATKKLDELKKDPSQKEKIEKQTAELEKKTKERDTKQARFKNAQADYKRLTEKYTPGIVAAKLTPNCKAVAMAKAIDESMGKVIDGMADITDKEGTKKKLTDAIKDLAQGEFKGKKFNPEAFGVSPIDFAIGDVLTQAKEKHGLKLTEDQEKKLNDQTFETLLQPALDKMLFVDKVFALLPGRNTSYSGDEYLATGYEAPCKNLYQQNRNVAHREWLNDPSKAYINKYYQEKKRINNFRRDKDLSALAKGETVVLRTPEQGVLAMFRYDKTSELICLAHSKNISSNDTKDLSENPVRQGYKIDGDHLAKEYTVDQIDLSGYKSEEIPVLGEDGKPKFDEKGKPKFEDKTRYAPQKEEGKDSDGTVIAGLAGGLALGTYFVDGIDTAAKTVYGVCKQVCKEAGKEVEKYVVKQFKDKAEYEKYLEAAKAGAEFEFTAAHKIRLTNNVMVLKRAAEKAGKVAFHGNQKHDANYIKIQSYINSKATLNTKQKAAI